MPFQIWGCWILINGGSPMHGGEFPHTWCGAHTYMETLASNNWCVDSLNASVSISRNLEPMVTYVTMTLPHGFQKSSKLFSWCISGYPHNFWRSVFPAPLPANQNMLIIWKCTKRGKRPRINPNLFVLNICWIKGAGWFHGISTVSSIVWIGRHSEPKITLLKVQRVVLVTNGGISPRATCTHERRTKIFFRDSSSAGPTFVQRATHLHWKKL